ncbi:MAG: hypothetical protein ACI87O_001048 [Planctomycetota bacterium]|jgi:hypothetical protein
MDLSLYGNAITDGGLVSLSGLHALQSFNLGIANVTWERAVAYTGVLSRLPADHGLSLYVASRITLDPQQESVRGQEGGRHGSINQTLYAVSMLFASMMLVAGSALVVLPQLPVQNAYQVRSVPEVAAPVSLHPPVWVVDSSGAGDFVEIADALLQTGEGSLLLVKPGTYHLPVVIDNRSVNLVADGAQQVVLTQSLRIQNLSAEQQVSIGGLELVDGFVIDNCSGPVQMQDCRVPQTNQSVDPPPGTIYNDWRICGIGDSKQLVNACSGVTISNCEFVGAAGTDASLLSVDGTPGQHGLLVIDSQVALYSCALAGGQGGIGFGPGHYPSVSGSGGDGLRVKGTTSQVSHCGLIADGGPAGVAIGDTATVFLGCDGTDLRVDSGSNAQACDPNSLSYRIDPVVRGGNLAWYTVEGPPGAMTYLMVANRLAWSPFGGGLGNQHLDAPLTIVPMGLIPASGSLTRPFPVLAPRTAAGFVGVYFQALTNVAGTVYRSGPQRLMVVHSSL